MNQMAPPATIQANLTKVQDAVEADIPLAAMQQQGLSPATWQLLTGTWLKANYEAATNAAATTLGTDQQLADRREEPGLGDRGRRSRWPYPHAASSRCCSAGPSTAGSARCAAPH